MTRTFSPAAAMATLVALLLIACAGPASPSPDPAATPGGSPLESPAPGVSPSPGTSPAPTPSPGASPLPGTTPTPLGPTVGPSGVTSAAQAAALVLASDERFHGVTPANAELIGQCCWYTAHEGAGDYIVAVELGWDDCPSGCISRHNWLFSVAPDGTITELESDGDQPIMRDPPTGSGPAALTIEAFAGPICPVEQVPPDPACAARPVGGAEVVVRTPDGAEVDRPLTDAAGRIALLLPAGAYYLEPQPVEGLLGVAEPSALRVAPGEQAYVALGYDTGIR